jgi:hypothetical protein
VPPPHIHRGAVRPEPGFHHRTHTLLQRAAAAHPGRIALDVLAREATQQLIDRHAKRLALDIPESHIERAESVQFLTAGRVEPAAVHELPEVVDARGILTNEHRRALVHHVLGTAFADPRNSGVGLNGHDAVALVKGRVRALRLVIADAPDLHLGNGCEAHPGRNCGCARKRQGGT